MKKLEPKQIPQFVALCVVSSGVFGYFVVRMVAPGSASASSAIPAPVAKPASHAAAFAPVAPVASGAAVAATPDPAASASSVLAAPPTPEMRDPFIVGYVDPKTAVSVVPALPVKPKLTVPSLPQMARVTLPGLSPFPAPAAPELPSGLSGLTIRPTGPAVSSIPALPAAPAPPAWQVTGVVQTDTDKLAILRDGDARRIVHSGDFVDSTYRVASVTRGGVVLRHGAYTYRLLLGGKPGAEPALPAASFTAPPMFTAPPVFTAPPSHPAPGRSGLPDSASLTQGAHSLSRLARLWLGNAPALPAHARTSRPPIQLALRFLNNAEDTDK